MVFKPIGRMDEYQKRYHEMDVVLADLLLERGFERYEGFGTQIFSRAGVQVVIEDRCPARRVTIYCCSYSCRYLVSRPDKRTPTFWADVEKLLQEQIHRPQCPRGNR